MPYRVWLARYLLAEKLAWKMLLAAKKKSKKNEKKPCGGCDVW
jgi:hypothetical protein